MSNKNINMGKKYVLDLSGMSSNPYEIREIINIVLTGQRSRYLGKLARVIELNKKRNKLIGKMKK